MKNKSKKSVKQSKIIAQQTKTTKALLRKKNHCRKSATTEHPKTSRKLSKTIRKVKKVYQEESATKNSTWPLHS